MGVGAVLVLAGFCSWALAGLVIAGYPGTALVLLLIPLLWFWR